MAGDDTQRAPERTALFFALMFLLTGGAIEGILRVAATLSSSASSVLVSSTGPGVPLFSPDPVLGLLPNPAYPGHDRNGYRNSRVPQTVAVVALGDSQTYGVGVEAHEAWPAVLGRDMAQPTYNMGVSGYGPTQSLLCFEDALARGPRVVVVALYSGNDLYDCFQTVYVRGQLDDLRSTDEALLQRVAAAEVEEPLEARILRLFGEWEEQAPDRSPRAFLRRHSRTWGLLRSTKRALRGPEDGWDAARRGALASGGRELALEAGTFRSVFQPAYRRCALDVEDPRIAVGLHAALGALRAMHDAARRAEVELLVLGIPTKELVFAPRLGSAAEEGEFGALVSLEEAFWADVSRDLAQAEIAFAPGLGALRASLENGVQPYPADNDGHPNAAGQAALAACVRAALVERGWL